MRIAVVGARGQLGAAVVHECAPAPRGRRRSTTPRSTSPTMRRCRRRSQRRVPTRSSTARRYNDVDARGGSSGRRAARQRVRRALAGPGRASARRGARPLQHRLRVRRPATRRTLKTDPPNPRSVYATSKLLGEWFALDAPRHYVLRVESLFGRAPGGRPAKGSVAHREGAASRAAAAGVRGSDGLADLRRSTPRARRGDCSSASARAGPVSLRQFSGRAPGSSSRAKRRGCSASSRGLDRRSRMRGCHACRAARPQYCALSNEKLRAARCRPGDSRSSIADAVDR